MCRTAGFARVEHRGTLINGACIACHRKWEPGRKVTGRDPELIDIFHHTNFGINFYTKYDEYLSAFFQPPEGEATIESVEPRVGEYGVRPIYVSKLESGAWQANFKLPPGLTPGWHDVATGVNGAISNSRRIAVDLPVPAAELRITGASDGKTWERGALDLGKGSILSAWVAGLPENADRNNVRAFLGGERLAITFLGSGGDPGERQLNMQVPGEIPGGGVELEVQLGDSRSNRVLVEITT
jgi:hypothetical protein